MDVSFLERLTLRAAYFKTPSTGDGDGGGGGTYNPHLLTKLVRNYRSHEDIISVPSRLFYDGDLVPCTDEAYRRSLARWEHLPAQGVPLIFHGVAGKDSQESNSPSWFNVHEIEVRGAFTRRAGWYGWVVVVCAFGVSESASLEECTHHDFSIGGFGCGG